MILRCLYVSSLSTFSPFLLFLVTTNDTAAAEHNKHHSREFPTLNIKSLFFFFVYIYIYFFLLLFLFLTFFVWFSCNRKWLGSMEKEKEKELVELYEAAKKAADASTSTDNSPSEETRCLDALEQLKNFPVNYKILVNTQVIIFLFTLQN